MKKKNAAKKAAADENAKLLSGSVAPGSRLSVRLKKSKSNVSGASATSATTATQATTAASATSVTGMRSSTGGSTVGPSVSQNNRSRSNREHLRDPQPYQSRSDRLRLDDPQSNQSRSNRLRPRDHEANQSRSNREHLYEPPSTPHHYHERGSEARVKQSNESRYSNQVPNTDSNIPRMWRSRLEQPPTTTNDLPYDPFIALQQLQPQQQQQQPYQPKEVQQEKASPRSPRRNKQLHQSQSMPPQSSFQNYNTAQPVVNPIPVYGHAPTIPTPYNTWQYQPNVASAIPYGSYQYSPAPPNPYFNTSQPPFVPVPPGVNYNQNAQAFTPQSYNYIYDPTGGQSFGNAMNYAPGVGVNPPHYKSFVPESIHNKRRSQSVVDHERSKHSRIIPKHSVHRSKPQAAIEAPEDSSVTVSRSSSVVDIADESRPGAVFVPCVASSKPGTYYCFQDPELKPGQYAIYYQEVSD